MDLVLSCPKDENKKHYISNENVCCYHLHDSGKVTEVYMVCGESVCVKETPEEIFKLRAECCAAKA